MILTITEDCEIALLCLSLEVLIELPHCRWSERNKHNPQFTRTYGSASYSSIFTHWFCDSFRKTNQIINSAGRQKVKKLQYIWSHHKQWRLAGKKKKEKKKFCTILAYQLSALKQCLIIICTYWNQDRMTLTEILFNQHIFGHHFFSFFCVNVFPTETGHLDGTYQRIHPFLIAKGSFHLIFILYFSFN